MKTILMIILLLFASDAFGADTYVNPSCANNGDGTASSCAAGAGAAGAYNAFTEVNALVGDLGGDTIWIAKGTEIRSNILLANASNFTIDAYGTGADPIINGGIQDSVWTAEGDLYYTAMAAKNSAWVNNVLLLDVVNKGDLSAGESWFDDPNNRLYIQLDGGVNPNSETVDVPDIDYPVRFNTCATAVIQNIHIKYGRICGFFGYALNTNITVQDCTIEKIGGWVGYNGGVVFRGTEGNEAENIIIRRNTVSWTINSLVELDWVDICEVSSNTLSYGGMGIEFYDAVRYCTVKRNSISNVWVFATLSSHHNAFWISDQGGTSKYNIFTENIAWNIDGTLIEVDAGSDNSALNNTLVSNSASDCPMLLRGGSFNSVNNIFYNPANQQLRIDAGTTYTGSNNAYYTTNAHKKWTYNGSDYSSLALYQAASGQDDDSMYADPLFYNATGHDFRLLPSSPCRDAGTDKVNYGK